MAAAAVTGCGSVENRADEVARPVDPPPLPQATPEPSPTLEPRTEERPPPTPRREGILSSGDGASFARLAATLGGDHGLAVSGLGVGRRVERAGPLQSGAAWSTSKVPVAMAVIARGDGQAEAADLKQAITASDNAAALRLWSTLGDDREAAAAADEQLRAAGDEHTHTESRRLRGPQYTPFGQTRWTLADQTRFTAGLACLPAGAEVLGLMNQVVPEQRWGLGAAGVDAQFKGGWGPGSEPGVAGGYFDRQMGVMVVDGKPLAVAIASRPANGGHEAGVRNLTEIARWLVSHADVRDLPQEPRC